MEYPFGQFRSAVLSDPLSRSCPCPTCWWRRMLEGLCWCEACCGIINSTSARPKAQYLLLCAAPWTAGGIACSIVVLSMESLLWHFFSLFLLIFLTSLSQLLCSNCYPFKIHYYRGTSSITGGSALSSVGMVYGMSETAFVWLLGNFQCLLTS